MSTDHQPQAAIPAAQQVTAYSPNVGHNVPPPAAQIEQAAQLSDKSTTHSARTLGANSPKAADLAQQQQRQVIRTAKDRARKKKSNQYDFRGDDDTTDRIYNRVELAGCNPSEAIRQLIEDGSTLAHRIIITPRTPPQQLEAFIGELRAWRHEFQAVRSRLNAPMPHNPEDQELVEQVKKWRAKAENLHEQIKELLDTAQATLRLLTSLTPEKIPRLRRVRVDLRRWTKDREEKAAKAETPEERKTHLRSADDFRTIVTLIDDLGIGEEGK